MAARVLRYTRTDGVTIPLANYPSIAPYFLSSVVDDEGDIWMTTITDGVYRNNGKELIHYQVKIGNKDVLISSIYKDNIGELWLGTLNAGIYKFDGQEFRKFVI